MDKRLFFPATQRNRDSIGDVLSEIIKKDGSILEIGSGSGEHGVVFQKRFPKIIWQTRPDLCIEKVLFPGLSMKIKKKMPQPLELDVENMPWKFPLRLTHSLQGIVSINMIPCNNGLGNSF